MAVHVWTRKTKPFFISYLVSSFQVNEFPIFQSQWNPVELNLKNKIKIRMMHTNIDKLRTTVQLNTNSEWWIFNRVAWVRKKSWIIFFKYVIISWMFHSIVWFICGKYSFTQPIWIDGNFMKLINYIEY